MQYTLFGISQPGPITFEEWKEYTTKLRERAARIHKMKRERVEKLTTSVFGFPVRGLCLHNAAIDSNYSGWMHGKTRGDMRTIRQANDLENNWDENRIVDRATKKAWERIVR